MKVAGGHASRGGGGGGQPLLVSMNRDVLKNCSVNHD